MDGREGLGGVGFFVLRYGGDVCTVAKGESGIIYCIRRKDVDSMCAQLTAGYHPPCIKLPD